MKFNTSIKKHEYPDHNGSGETLIVHIKGVVPVSIRESALEISAAFESIARESGIKVEEGKVVEGGDTRFSDNTTKILSQNLSRIFRTISEIVVDWNAEDDNGKIPVNADTVALVMWETVCMEILGWVVNPLKAGKSPKLSNSSETNWSVSSSEEGK